MIDLKKKCWREKVTAEITANPEFPFWPRKRRHSTTVSPVRDTVNTIFRREHSRRSAIRSSPEIAPICGLLLPTPTPL
jgi:hypothetical protein